MTQPAVPRLDALPSRRFLKDPGPHAAEAAWAQALGAAVVLAESPEAALALAVMAAVAPGDRVAIAEPCPEAHYRLPLACGARVVDVGRDSELRLRAEGLALVLRDGAAVVLVADPADPAPCAGEAAVVRGLAVAAIVVEDRRQGAWDPASPALQVLAGAGEAPVGLVAASPEDAAALRALRGPLPESVARRAAALRSPAGAADGEALGAALAPLAGARVVVGPASYAFLQVDGVDGAALAAALAAAGVTAERRPHHTWRGGVRIALPADPVAVTAAVTALTPEEPQPLDG